MSEVRRLPEPLTAYRIIVPSVVARMGRNFIFNTSHEDFKQIKVGLETPIWWDNRLFD